MERTFFFRVNELNRRLEIMQRENAKLKSEYNPLKDKYRDLENEYSGMQRRLEDKEAHIKHIEEIKR